MTSDNKKLSLCLVALVGSLGAPAAWASQPRPPDPATHLLHLAQEAVGQGEPAQQRSYDDLIHSGLEDESGETAEERNLRITLRQTLRWIIYAGVGYDWIERVGQYSERDPSLALSPMIGVRTAMSDSLEVLGRAIFVWIGDWGDQSFDGDDMWGWGGGEFEGRLMGFGAEVGLRGRPLSSASIWYLGASLRLMYYMATGTDYREVRTSTGYSTSEISVSDESFGFAVVLDSGFILGQRETWDIGIRIPLGFTEEPMLGLQLVVGMAF